MRRVLRIISLIICITMLSAILPVIAGASNVTYGYDNLNSEAGDLTIGFIGGSITIGTDEQERYATHVTNWFQEQYPNKNVIQVNAGISGTPSDYGMYRLTNDISVHEPDVVFVEYAVNDKWFSRLTLIRQMESIVRQLLSLPKQPVIVLLYSMEEDTYNTIGPVSIPAHKEVADYYNIGDVDFYSYMWGKVNDGTYIWHDDGASGKQLSEDGVHPNAEGHRIYADFIIEKLVSENLLHKADFVNTPMTWDLSANPHTIETDDASLTKSGKWTGTTANGAIKQIRSTAYGDYVSMTFTGDSVGVAHSGGKGEWVIDEGTPNEVRGTIDVNNRYSNWVICDTKLSPGSHTFKVTNTGEDSSTFLRIDRLLVSDGRYSVPAKTADNGDHIPGTVPENLFKTPEWRAGLSNMNTTAVTHNYADKIVKFSTTAALSADADNAVQGASFEVGSHVIGGALSENTNYVFRIRAKDAGTNGRSAKLNLSYDNHNVFSAEYGQTGMTLSSQYQDFVATFNSGSAANSNICLGMPSAAAYEHVHFNIGDGVYLAPEVAYDVSLTPKNSAAIDKGGEAVFNARLLNQMGSVGTLTQDFTYALTDENGNVAEDITLTPSQDTRSVTVAPATSAAIGKYYLKATDTVNNWQKTLEISVTNEIASEPEDELTQDDTTVIVHDTFDGLTADIDVKSLPGWRAVSDYDLTTLFKATAKDNAMHITYGTRTSTWATIGTQFYRDLPDYGEGVYEISYRFMAENFTNNVARLFNPHGYVENADGTRTDKCLIYNNFEALQFKDGEGTTLGNAKACTKTEKKWIDFKYIIDTVGNKATVSYKIEGEEWKSASGPIGESDGLSYLLLDVRFGTGAAKDTEEHTAAMQGEYYFDNFSVIKRDMEYDILLEYDFDTMDTAQTIFDQSSDIWSLTGGGRTKGVFDVMPAKVSGVAGQVLKFAPRTTITNSWEGENDRAYIHLPKAEEGQYEVSYRINILDNDTQIWELMCLYGYATDEDGLPTDAKLFYNYSDALRFYNLNKVSGIEEYEQARFMPSMISTFPANTWIEVVYYIDTVSCKMMVEWKADGEDEYYRHYSEIGDFDGLSYLVLQYGVHWDKVNSEFKTNGFLLDDLKVTKLKNWYDGATDKPVTSLAGLTEAEDGTRTLKYVSHYHNNEAASTGLDVYLGLYGAQGKLISAQKADVALDAWLTPLSGNKKTLIFTIPADEEISYAKIMKWQDGTCTPISKAIDVPVD